MFSICTKRAPSEEFSQFTVHVHCDSMRTFTPKFTSQCVTLNDIVVNARHQLAAVDSVYSKDEAYATCKPAGTSFTPVLKFELNSTCVGAKLLQCSSKPKYSSLENASLHHPGRWQRACELSQCVLKTFPEVRCVSCMLFVVARMFKLCAWTADCACVCSHSHTYGPL